MSQTSVFSFHSIHLIWELALKSIRVKYKNSILGFFWSLINPLLFLLIFNYIFGYAFTEIRNYPLYATTGIIIWIIFPVTTNQIISSLLENSGILKSVAISPILFPISALVASLLNFYLVLIPFVGIMLFVGMELTWHFFIAMFVIHLFFIFILGISLFLTACNIYFRDIGLLWNTLMPALFYFTPIAYPESLVPSHLQWPLKLNPIYHFVQIFRDCIYKQSIPSLQQIGLLLLISIGSLIIGTFIFQKLKRNFISFY